MARRPSQPERPEPAQLTIQQMQQAILRLRKRIAEVEAFDPSDVSEADPRAAVQMLETAIKESLVRTFGNNTTEFHLYSPASMFNWPLNMAYGTSIQEILDSLSKCKTRSLNLLNQAVRSLEEQIEEQSESADSSGDSAKFNPDPRNRQVFVVHGHDNGARESVARFLEKLNFQAIILHEQPSGGRTIIEKVEDFWNVSFAVVLLTPDDEGNTKGEDSRPRVRQNVILELGYFIGKLGRSRVCALKRGDLEVPSNFDGFVYVNFDDNGSWKTDLSRELESSVYEIDWNKAMR